MSAGVPPIREVDYGSALYELMLRFRDAELRRPLGLALSPADREGEEGQRHFAAVAAEEPRIRAAVVMKPLPAEPGRSRRFKLRQMAVASDCRGQGLGQRIVRFAEAAVADGVEEPDGVEVVLGARASAVGFYERLGYVVCGAPFTEVGQPHLPMRRLIR